MEPDMSSPTTDAPDAPTGLTEPPESNVDDSGAAPDAEPSREAQRYRLQLRATETERDGLRGQLEQLQRHQVEAIAADRVTQPSAIWKADGLDLPSLLGDDGQIDQAKVSAAVIAAADSLGLQRRPPAGHVPSEGNIPDVSSGGASWHKFLSPHQA